MANCILCHDTGMRTHYELGSGGPIETSPCGCREVSELDALRARVAELESAVRECAAIANEESRKASFNLAMDAGRNHGCRAVERRIRALPAIANLFLDGS